MRVSGRHGGSTKPVLILCIGKTLLLDLKGDRAKNKRRLITMSPKQRGRVIVDGESQGAA